MVKGVGVDGPRNLATPEDVAGIDFGFRVSGFLFDVWGLGFRVRNLSVSEDFAGVDFGVRPRVNVHCFAAQIQGYTHTHTH